MSLSRAAGRWNELLAWVRADLAPDNPEFGACKAPANWRPRTQEERVEERFIRRLLLAKTAEDIGRACCPAFIVKGLSTTDDANTFGSVELEAAFRLLAKSLNLTDAKAYEARRFADTLNDRTRTMWGADIAVSICASKFNIIREAVETVHQVAQAKDFQAIAEASGAAGARVALAERSPKPVGGSAACPTCKWSHDSNLTEFTAPDTEPVTIKRGTHIHTYIKAMHAHMEENGGGLIGVEDLAPRIGHATKSPTPIHQTCLRRIPAHAHWFLSGPAAIA